MGQAKKAPKERQHDYREYILYFPEILARRIKTLAAAREQTELSLIREAIGEWLAKAEVPSER